MIAFHANNNLILQKAFQFKIDHHRIAAYNTIMTCFVAYGLSVDLQILDNKASSIIKRQSASSGMPPSNSSLQTCIATIVRSAPFAHSKTLPGNPGQR